PCNSLHLCTGSLKVATWPPSWKRLPTLVVTGLGPGRLECRLQPVGFSAIRTAVEQRDCFSPISFECSKCSHTWKSAKVTVIFHMQLLRTALGPARGKVKMRVFGQKCRRCRSGKFEEPKFSDKTAECCLHNLVQKILEKCYERGRKAHALLQPEPEDGNCWGPHDRNGCEACACGLCFEPSRPASQGPWEGISLQSSPLAWRHELKRRAGDASAPCVWLLVVAAAVLILLASSLQK
uniref:3CxxC-type domain-containing protein n=1 Tax=Varanus komodoensis TaxID=61221 RepID=A0A8D2IZ90_VARKO